MSQRIEPLVTAGRRSSPHVAVTISAPRHDSWSVRAAASYESLKSLPEAVRATRCASVMKEPSTTTSRSLNMAPEKSAFSERPAAERRLKRPLPSKPRKSALPP